MKIGIDARFFGPKCKGLGRYTQKLLEYLAEIDQINEYYIFLTRDGFEKFQPAAKNFRKILANYHWYTWQEQIFFPMLLKKHKLDLVHFCHFNVPIFYCGKFIVTIHDLILFSYPTIKNTTLNKLYYFFKLGIYHLVIRLAVRRAEKIIAVSEFTKSDIINKLAIMDDRIKVIYEGYEIKNKENNFLGDEDAVFSKYGIMKPYIMYAGNAYPHKNLQRLCKSFSLLKSRFKNLQLVLVGETDYFYKKIKSFAEVNEIKDVIFTGFVSDIELEVLYKNTECFVFPSLYEGFGLPPLEAISRGAAVACSEKTSMPEVLSDGAEYFNPENESSIALSIEQLLLDNKYKQEIIENGKKRLKVFNWKKMAQEIKNEYDIMLNH